MARAPAEGRDRLVKVKAAVAVLERSPAEEDATFRPYDPDQVLLMVPVPQERVPAGDLAHFVSDLVKTGALDLSAIYASCEEERGYEPAWSASLSLAAGLPCAQLRAAYSPGSAPTAHSSDS